MIDEGYIARIKAATEAGIARQRDLVAKGVVRDPNKPKRVKSQPSANDVPSEWQEQRMVCQWLLARKVVYFAVPNGGSRGGGAIEGARMKMIGVKAGIPDLVILSPPPNFPLCRGAVIEMKRRKGSSVSEAQKVWLQYFADYDWATCVANGADEAIRQLEEWGY